MPTCQKCSAVFPNYVTVDGKVRNLCSRRFCLICSPFGANNRKDLTKSPERLGGTPDKRCPKCGDVKGPESFYRKGGKRGGEIASYCKSCHLAQVKGRERRFKIKCLEYKGVKCQRCGYDKSVGAMHFHHRDPKGKDFKVSDARSFGPEVQTELDKCDLLCANCHAEVHEDGPIV